MAKFYFHFFDGTERHLDTLGIDLKTAEDAYLEAYRAAIDIWREYVLERQDPRPCVFEVTNSQDEALFALPFIEVIESCRKSTSAQQRAPKQNALWENYARTQRSYTAFRETLNVTKATLQETNHLIATIRALQYG